MAEDDPKDIPAPSPPAITAIKQEARSTDPRNSPMTRSFTDNMREEREDLKEAAEQTLNIIVDIGLDGCIKWVSPSWRQVVGTPPELAEGRMISDVLVTNKNVFNDAIESMKEDDSHSRFIRFAVRLGPDSVLRKQRSSAPQRVPEEKEEEEEKGQDDKTLVEEEVPKREEEVAEFQSLPAVEEEKGKEKEMEKGKEGGEEMIRDNDILNMEAQGIMVYSRSADKTDHVCVSSFFFFFFFLCVCVLKAVVAYMNML